MKRIITLVAVLASSQVSAWWDDNGSYNSNGYGNGYGYGDGYGRGYGDGRAAGDMEGDFNMTFSGRARGNADMRGDYYGDYYGQGYGYGDGRGYGYSYDRPYYGYGYAPYGYGYPTTQFSQPVPAQPKGPADDDKDGVINTSDLCPDTAAGVEVDVLGCDAQARIVLRGVNFKTDSDELTEKSLSILDGVSDTLSKNPQLKILVAGHTDTDGDDNYNKDLSQRRAQSVVNYLIAKSVNPNNLIAKGYGEEQPIASNETAEGKALNRRVELNRL